MNFETRLMRLLTLLKDSMPEAMHRKLQAMAKKRGLSGKSAKKYVYGTMSKLKSKKNKVKK